MPGYIDRRGTGKVAVVSSSANVHCPGTIGNITGGAFHTGQLEPDCFPGTRAGVVRYSLLIDYCPAALVVQRDAVMRELPFIDCYTRPLRYN